MAELPPSDDRIVKWQTSRGLTAWLVAAAVVGLGLLALGLDALAHRLGWA